MPSARRAAARTARGQAPGSGSEGIGALLMQTRAPSRARTGERGSARSRAHGRLERRERVKVTPATAVPPPPTLPWSGDVPPISMKRSCAACRRTRSRSGLRLPRFVFRVRQSGDRVEDLRSAAAVDAGEVQKHGGRSVELDAAPNVDARRRLIDGHRPEHEAEVRVQGKLDDERLRKVAPPQTIRVADAHGPAVRSAPGHGRLLRANRAGRGRDEGENEGRTKQGKGDGTCRDLLWLFVPPPRREFPSFPMEVRGRG